MNVEEDEVVLRDYARNGKNADEREKRSGEVLLHRPTKLTRT
jgi:hypothetical protein